jgi:predicted MFS family arabinose efflux permease
MISRDSREYVASRRWVMLAVLFLARTAMGFQFQSVASVAPLLVQDLAIDLALFGTLVGAWMLPGVAIAIPGGLLGTRFGDRLVVLFGLALMVVGSALTAGASGFWIALVGRVVSGTGAVLLNVLLAKMVADWFADRDLATAMGVLVTSWPVGIGLALITLGPLAAAKSWTVALQTSTAVCVMAFVLVAALYRDPPATRVKAAAHLAPSGLTRGEILFASLAGAVWTLYNVAYIVVVSFAPLLLAGLGLPPANAALVASAATWPLVVSVLLGGILADRTGRSYAIMHACFIGMAICIPLLLMTPSPVTTLAIVGLVAGPAAGIIMTLPARVLRPETRNIGMGIYFTWYYLGMAVLPGIAGWCRDLSGFAAAPLLFASLLLVGAIASAVFFRRLERSAVRNTG